MVLLFYISFLLNFNHLVVAEGETVIAGVFQGKTLFVQNPYNSISKSFCVEKVFVNEKPVDFNINQSAIKIDFKGIDIYSPVYVKLVHRDTTCRPVIINPDAITYHNSFSFTELNLIDTALIWKSRGEKAEGSYVVEKIDMGLWTEQEIIPAKGIFGGATYQCYPLLQNGPNKFRVKYIFPNNEYLYSRDLDIHFYPEEVTFRPTATDSKLFLSRGADYKIYDAKGTMVMSGLGAEIDVSILPSGEYVVYFDEEYPGVFRRK